MQDRQGDDDDGLIAAHLRHLTYIGLRPGTLVQRRLYLRRLAAFVSPTALLHITTEQLEAFVAQRQLGPEARNNAVTHTQGFFRWARRARLVVEDPSEDLERPKRPKRTARPMPEPDLGRAIAAAPEPIRSWLYLGAYAGLRCCEIAPLRGEDRVGSVLRIREQKGGDEGEVLVGQVLDQALAHLPARGWWFERWDDRGGPISANQLQRHGNRFLHSHGIDHTMHTLRHRFVTMIHEAGGYDVFLTQKMARHGSSDTTRMYVALVDARARLAVDGLAPPAIGSPPHEGMGGGDAGGRRGGLRGIELGDRPGIVE